MLSHSQLLYMSLMQISNHPEAVMLQTHFIYVHQMFYTLFLVWESAEAESCACTLSIGEAVLS